jgi:alkanesulfonate monooxygenase SsuD/methylene tetrahydromethanopterin reductase-like flavin-dependent oxidoreductase (luciferase family)
MKLGVMALGLATVADVVAQAQQAEAEGFATFAIPNVFQLDAIGALTVAGHATSRIRLVSAVVPTYPRHPAAMAQQALTAASASNNRFTLGIGLSHRDLIEGLYGYSFDKPARHMREYLSVLLPLLGGGPVTGESGSYTFRGQLNVPVDPVPCVIAAMGPVMLGLAGELTAGTLLFLTGANGVDPAAAREVAAKEYASAGNRPSYRAMLDASGLEGPGDSAIVGSEADVERGLRELAEAGATQFNAVFYGDAATVGRTRTLLSELAKQRH